MDSLCMDFVNTRWYLTHRINREMLKDHEYVRDFFSKRGFAVDVVLNESISSKLLVFRELLISILTELIQLKSMTPNQLSLLERYLNAAAFTRTLEQNANGFHIRLVPVENDWNWILSEIAASLLMLMEEHDIGRIRICENPECSWFFYDESKSRNKRWCCSACGNLIKVRKFRASQKMGEA